MTSTSARNNLIFRARRSGYRIDTSRSTIYLNSSDGAPYCKAVDRLIEQYKFVIQYQDSVFENTEGLRFYISLPINSVDPITGDVYDIKAQSRFADKAQQVLQKMGFRTFNPFKNGLPSSAPVHQHMRADYSALCQCSAIIMLPGWQFSNGCKHEFMVASDMRIPIYTMDSEFNVKRM